MPTRADIVKEARSWIGTPYHAQGRSKGIGVDCGGLILQVAQAVGIVLADKDIYQRINRAPPRGKWLLSELDNVCGAPKETLEPGDIAVFWVNPISKRAEHLAIVTDYGMIHTDSEIGKVVEHVFGEYWMTRLLRIHKLPGI